MQFITVFNILSCTYGSPTLREPRPLSAIDLTNLITVSQTFLLRSNGDALILILLILELFWAL